MKLVSMVASAAALVLLVMSGSASAQAPQKAQAPAASTAPSEPSAAALAAAREIMTLKQSSNIYEGAVVRTIQSVRNSLVQNNLNLQKDLEEVSLKLAGELRGRESQITDAMAIIYATDFTEQELKDLVAFYKTPLGKKAIEQEPKTLETSLNYMRNWGDDFAVEVNEKFTQELKKRGKDL